MVLSVFVRLTAAVFTPVSLFTASFRGSRCACCLVSEIVGFTVRFRVVLRCCWFLVASGPPDIAYRDRLECVDFCCFGIDGGATGLDFAGSFF
jgi:hypothetical protein